MRVALNDRVVVAETEAERLLVVLRLVVGDAEEVRLFDGEPVVVLELVVDFVPVGDGGRCVVVPDTDIEGLIDEETLPDVLADAETLQDSELLEDIDGEGVSIEDTLELGDAVLVRVAVVVTVPVACADRVVEAVVDRVCRGDTEVLTEEVEVLETETERDVVGEVVPVLEEVVVAVVVVDCEEDLEELIELEMVVVEVDERLVDILRVGVPVFDAEPVGVVDSDWLRVPAVVLEVVPEMVG